MNKKMILFARAGNNPALGAIMPADATAASAFVPANPARASEPNPQLIVERAERRVMPQSGWGWNSWLISFGG
jgi:hypothetical protein